MLAKRRNADGNVQGCLFVGRMVPFEIQYYDTLSDQRQFPIQILADQWFWAGSQLVCREEL